MKTFKVWVDDMRQPPNDDWIWCHSTKEAIVAIKMYDRSYNAETILIDLDHDSGDYCKDGGDFIKILDWLEETGIVDTGYFFHIHSMNPVGRENMRRIIKHNGWREVK